MARNWKCNVDVNGHPCGNKANIKAGRGKTAKYFCEEHELIAAAMMLTRVI